MTEHSHGSDHHGHASSSSALSHAGEHGHDEHHSHGGLYFVVFLALCGLTALSVLADSLQMSNKYVLNVVVLAVATAKAMCVMLYFMHLKFETSWKYLLLAPTFILAAAVPFALAPDIGMHYYVYDVPQVHEAEMQAARGESSGSEH